MRISAALFAFLAACAGESEEIRDARVHDLMANELEPAADGVWDNAGWIITEAGEEKLWPTTEAGWAEVAASAERIAEIAESLKGNAYRQEGTDWDIYADGLVVAAERARVAALAQDEQEVFDAGGHIYQVCRACHERFIADEDVSERALDIGAGD